MFFISLVLIRFSQINLVNRGPTKRKIKPVASILNSFTADIGDSESDDSDYNPPNMEDDDIEIESDAEKGENKQEEGENDDHSKKNGNAKGSSKSSKSSKNGNSDGLGSGSSNSSSDSDSDSSSSGSESSGNSSSSSSKTDSEKKKKKAKESFEAEGTNNQPQVTTTANESISQPPQKKLSSNFDKIRICSVCLGDISRNYDEIVECDACGISVHELCYGITADDAESIHSDASSASTEPWFCDPCKAGVRSPVSFCF